MTNDRLCHEYIDTYEIIRFMQSWQQAKGAQLIPGKNKQPI